tara:strand:+ start:1990 stop:2199 length:210 start_codon:yes stop_codon:yes gene_type:complete
MSKFFMELVVLLLDRHESSKDSEQVMWIYIIGIFMSTIVAWVVVVYVLSLPIEILEIFYPPIETPCDCE